MSEAMIEAALEAAVRELLAHDPKFPLNAEACRNLPLGEWKGTIQAKQAAAAVAAFLRVCQRWPVFASLDDLAAAVERAAKDGE